MTLYECKVGDKCKIISCKSEDYALKDRFMSFGFVRNKACEVISHSIRKLAIAVMIEGTQVALRDSEAKMIEVELIK